MIGLKDYRRVSDEYYFAFMGRLGMGGGVASVAPQLGHSHRKHSNDCPLIVRVVHRQGGERVCAPCHF